jgi:hypothetical protein
MTRRRCYDFVGHFFPAYCDPSLDWRSGLGSGTASGAGSGLGVAAGLAARVALTLTVTDGETLTLVAGIRVRVADATGLRDGYGELYGAGYGAGASVL